jgi:hypothetical protein
LLGIYVPILAQNANSDTIVKKVKPPKSVEYGLNMTALVVEFIPLLNRTTERTGPYVFSYKRFRGQNGFRMALGAHINPNESANISEPLNNINFRLGYERRKTISEHWRYSRGIDAMFFTGNLNSPMGNILAVNQFGEASNGLGVGLTLGAEYLILPNLSVSTEGIFFIGGVANGAVLTFVPPVCIFLNAKFK